MKKKTYRVKLTWMDTLNPSTCLIPRDGTLVRKVQPRGCPKNGTMGQCYIESMEGEFLGMVDERSLEEV